MPIRTPLYRLMPVVSLGLLLAACGGDSSSHRGDPPPGDGDPVETSTVSGAVAVGAPVSGAQVSLTCQSGGSVAGVVSNANGSYTITVPDENFPCILRATGGNLPAGLTALHSFAPAAGSATVNLTPLTDLALALAINNGAGNSSIADWYAAPTNWTEVGAALGDALEVLRDTLIDADYTLPSTWPAGSLAPFTEAFTPSVTPAADTLDRLLEDLQAAILDAGDTYDNVLAGFVTTPASLPTDVGGGNGGGEPPVETGAVGLADFGVYSGSSSKGEFLAAVSGSWPVAIYRVPSGQDNLYGEGTLTISGTESDWSMTLTGGDGSTIFNRGIQGALTGQLMPFIGQLFINHGTSTSEYMTVFAQPDGAIEGSAGGEIDIEFRNNIVAYGEALPDVLAGLAGTWSKQVAVYCSGPFGAPTAVTNSVTITATGEVTAEGETQLCGGDLPQAYAWGGLDDFVIPNPEGEGFIIYLDATSEVGIGNAFEIWISEIENPTVTRMKSFIGGELFEMKNPVQQ
ncbi:carboxypeptidase-like regulatory domain-containing protein [Alcanivorax sp. S71-1-4]|uniref:carboxypeptidase-like regulatory domain-containing protein n=1 Tax=Alcanivorax sp. S71-1-4 TaxID=1177159 RepID=UPI00135C6BF2|nr:carboxypeptidase-like regulatory domain-containing protein [Alcanivorax sp. S71-1-4]